MKNTILLLTVFCVGALAQAQWYFETGVNDSKFAQYVNLTGTKTTLHSYNGLRDFSHAVGYIFPFKKLDERATLEGKPAALRLAVGLGFDQMNLRTQAEISNNKIPVHYNMGQVQGQLNLLYAPTLITKKMPDEFGVRRPGLNLLLEGGLSYNMYTNAVRTYTNNRGNIDDLKVDKEFVDAYSAFSFGGGLEFPLSRHATLYGKYVVENAFTTEEKGTREKFSTVKRRVMVGLRLDMRLKNRLKVLQKQREALEAEAQEAPLQPKEVDLNPLYNKIDVLEQKLREQEQKLNAKKHKDYVYLPEVAPVLFNLNSSELDEAKYANNLNELARFMKENPSLRLKLVGYADSQTGSESSNLTLSQERAQAVFDYLSAHGIAENRILYEGAGETLQFGTEQWYDNRRTEIIILK